MARSKLELCLDVLRVLEEHEGSKVSWILLRARVNYVTLKPVLQKLLEEALVEEAGLRDGSVLYAITSRGRVILEELVRFRTHSPVASLVFA